VNSIFVFIHIFPNLLFLRLYSENNTQTVLIQTKNLPNNEINSKLSLLETVWGSLLVYKTRHVTAI
jgi:hypothetical protein